MPGSAQSDKATNPLSMSQIKATSPFIKEIAKESVPAETKQEFGKEEKTTEQVPVDGVKKEEEKKEATSDLKEGTESKKAQPDAQVDKSEVAEHVKATETEIVTQAINVEGENWASEQKADEKATEPSNE